MQIPEIASDGLRLAACLNGFEGQCWRNGRIVGSRWWREAPSDSDWRIFAEALGVVSEHAPAVVTPGALARPWRRNDWRPPNPDVLDRRAGFWIAAGFAAALLSGTAYVAGVEISYRRLEARVGQLEKDVGPVRRASQRVTAANSELRRLQAPIKGYDGLTLMSIVAQVMKTADARASNVQLQGDTLRVSVPVKYRASTDQVIRLLEDEPGIANVRLAALAQRTDVLELEADLERTR